MIKYILLIMLTSSLSFAVSFKKGVKDNKKRSAAAVEDSEVKILSGIIDCLKTKKSVQEIRTCANKYLSSSMEQSEKDRLLVWFEQQVEISYPTRCADEKLKFINDEIRSKTKVFLCSKFMRGELEKIIVFFLSKEGEGLALLNLKED